MRNLAKNYDPKAFEKRIYENWEKNGVFKAEIRKDKKPFTIVMPPPNITGQLHNFISSLFLRAESVRHQFN